MSIYNLLKDNASKFDLNFPDDDIKIKIHHKEPILSEGFIKYFSSEFKTLIGEESKKYITKTVNVEDTDIDLFILNKDYLIHLKDNGSFLVFNNKLEFLGLYCSDIEYQDKLDNTPINSFLSLVNAKHFNYCLYERKYKFKINTNNDLSIIKTSEHYDNTDIIYLQGAGNNQITSIQFNESDVLVKFKNSFYQKLKLDYDFNILEIDFHSKIKNKLNIGSSLFNIKNYQELVNALSINFDFYSLVNDSKFPIKLKEHDFKKHFEIIKEITLNKKNIFYLLSLTDDLQLKTQFISPIRTFKTPSEIEALDEMFKNYLGKTYTEIMVESQKTNSFKYYMKDILMFLLTTKQNNIFPIDLPVVKKIEEINLKINNWHKTLNHLKKDNKTFKTELNKIKL